MKTLSKLLLTAMMASGLMLGSIATAADYQIRATANSNENVEDYDGLIVFKDYVVEGSKNGITDIMGMKFTDAGLKCLNLDGHAYMAAMWWMSNDAFMAMPEDMRKVVVDGFYALQQATFASPKRKSIQAYAEFKAAGGDLYVPSPGEKQAFKTAAAPMYDWFQKNVDGGEKVFEAITEAV